MQPAVGVDGAHVASTRSVGASRPQRRNCAVERVQLASSTRGQAKRLPVRAELLSRLLTSFTGVPAQPEVLAHMPPGPAREIPDRASPLSEAAAITPAPRIISPRFDAFLAGQGATRTIQYGVAALVNATIPFGLRLVLHHLGSSEPSDIILLDY